MRCELLSNFLYFCSRNNPAAMILPNIRVVNCSQIFCTFAVETTSGEKFATACQLWIALKFFVLLQSKQQFFFKSLIINVVNCSQIFCTFAVETTVDRVASGLLSCELLSNFLYFCSRNNRKVVTCLIAGVVNCSQIFCTFAVETTLKLNKKTTK